MDTAPVVKLGSTNRVQQGFEVTSAQDLNCLPVCFTVYRPWLVSHIRFRVGWLADVEASGRSPGEGGSHGARVHRRIILLTLLLLYFNRVTIGVAKSKM